MLYLLDANVLIRAHEDYYPLDRVAPFWEWLLTQAAAGYVKMPFEIHDEIARSDEALGLWARKTEVVERLVLNEEVDQNIFNHVVDYAYAPDLTDYELAEMGRDPFLLAYGMAEPNRTIVTKEVSSPGKSRGRRKLPDACDILDVRWLSDFKFYKEMDFRIE